MGHQRKGWKPQKLLAQREHPSTEARILGTLHKAWSLRRLLVGMCTQVRTARSQWLAEEEGGIDDCTAIVCILQHGSRARRTGSLLPLEAAKATAISRSLPQISPFRPCKAPVKYVRAVPGSGSLSGGSAVPRLPFCLHL